MSEREYFDRLVDEDSLQEFLETELGTADTYEISYHTGGNSNEIIFVTWGDQEFVLRRPPLDETADTAHEILREFQVLSVLQDSAAPVPRTITACEDRSVLDCEFYLMERVGGEVIGDTEPDRFRTAAHRRRVGQEMVDTLARIHEVDYESVGLAQFGRPEGFTQRQVDRWTEQKEWVTSRDILEREVTELDKLGAWLAGNIPETHPKTLVHGDFRLDNMMFGTGTPPKLVAVLDWELSTLGDPLTDLGFLLAHWRDSKDEHPPAIPEWTTPYTAHEDYPTRVELVDQYQTRTGIDFEHERFYRALAVFKEAVAGEMFYGRYLAGETEDPLYPKMEERVPAMADRGLRIIHGEEPL